jgi:hypothetical protein
MLLSLRALMVLGLAVLGAMPFARCSRLSLTREQGASVALALVIDDSLSMRARGAPGGEPRFERARRGARELLASAREGDAVSVVLGGTPARIALAATTDLAAVRRVLDELKPADRSTDVSSAVALARSSLTSLPHTDKRVIVLGDLAGAPLPEGTPPASAPLAELRGPLVDCAIIEAAQRARRLDVRVACSGADAARDRDVLAEALGSNEPIARARLASEAGLQSVTLELPARAVASAVRLSGADQLPEDDAGAVASEETRTVLGVIADPSRSGVSTGGGTVVEQAAAALDRGIQIRPLPLVPEDARELASTAALVLDDPVGFGPEARATLVRWLERGGAALALLGPEAENVPLGSSLQPFVEGAVRWGKTPVEGIDPASAGWMGGEAESLGRLLAKGRVELDGALPAGAQTAARWKDGPTFFAMREVGRGWVATVGLPGSVELSDFALRPGFLATLDRLLVEAERRSGQRVARVGAYWTFGNEAVRVENSRKEVVFERAAGSGDSGFAPTEHGRYRVLVGGTETERIVTLDPAEVLERSHEPGPGALNAKSGERPLEVDISREIAGILLALLFAELSLRALVRVRRHKPA